MATNHNFRIKNGLEVAGSQIIDSDGVATFGSNVTIAGNLVVSGTTTQTGATITNSNFTGLSNANAGNSTDFGFYGKYVESSTSKYAGLYYDASTDNTFKLFVDSQSVPTTTVNESATGYALASLQIATQSASDNSTKAATTAYVTTAISNLVDSAPGTLNTLNELAAALGDDANFSTTVTNSIAAKLPLTGGTITGTVVFNSAPTFNTAITMGSTLTVASTIGIAGTAVIDSNRNLVNIGTLTASGNINTTSGGFQINGATVIASNFRITPFEHVIFGSTTGYIQHPSNSSANAWAYGVSGGGANPGVDRNKWGLHYYNGTSWSNPFYVDTSGNAVFTGEVEGASLDINGVADIAGDTVITGSSGSGNAFVVQRGDNSAHVLRIHNSGEVVVPNNYLFAASSGTSFYSQGDAVFRTAIRNDTSGMPLLVSDGLNVTGDIQSNGTVILQASGRNLTNIGTISSGAITASGNIAITAGTGQRYIEIASGTTNAKTWRIYNGISWNPDALLIYNHTDDATALTIEPGKLGVNRGANSLTEAFEVTGGASISGNITSTGGNLVATSGYVQTGGAYFSGNLRVLNNAGNGWNTFATRTDGLFNISNVILEGGTTGTRLRGSQWFYDSNNAGRLYFTINGHSYYKATTGHHFRANGDVTRLNIGPTGAINIGGGDTQVSGTAVLAVANTVVLDTSRNLTSINNATAVSFLSTNGYWVGGTRRIDGSGNLENIGSITATGNISTSAAFRIGTTSVIDSNRRILAADGAANVPYYTFSADTDTGFYRPSANAIGFSLGGTERWRLTSSGTFQALNSASFQGIGGSFSGSLALNTDSSQLQLGSGNRAQIFHNSAALYLRSSTGGVLVQGPSLSHYASDASTLYFKSLSSGLSFGGTTFLTSARVLQNVSGNISMFTNDSGYLVQGSNAVGNSSFSDTIGAGFRFQRVTGGSNRFTTAHHNVLQIPNTSGDQYLAQIAFGTGTTRLGWRSKDTSFSSWYEIWHSGNDGSGSALDADTVDTLHASSFLRSDASDSYTSGTLQFASGTGFDLASNDVYASMRVMRNNGGITDGMYIGYGNSGTGPTRIFGGGATSGGLRVNGSGVNDVKIDGNTVWHAGNDGSGSGLDADLLDGKDHTAFGATLATYGTTGAAGARIRCTAPFATNSAHMFQITISLYGAYQIEEYVVGGYMYPTTNQWYLPKCMYTGTTTPDIIVGRDNSGYAYISIVNRNYAGVRVHNMTRGYYTSVADTYDPWTITLDNGTENSVTPGMYKIWQSSNDGSGSGLDADLLDGQHASAFLTGNQTISLSGAVTGSGTTSISTTFPTGAWLSDQNGGQRLYFSNGGNSFYKSSNSNHNFRNSSDQDRFVVSHTSAQHYGDMRSTIFYDYNDTSTYVDPNSTSQLTSVYASNIIQSSNSVRAPIFYDSADTTYYVDPGASSKVVGSFYMGGALVVGATAAQSAMGQIAVASSGNPYISFHGGGDTTRDAYFQYLTAQDRFYHGEVAYTETAGSYRAPLFYDSNNTGYYLDPAASSKMVYLGLAVDPYTSGSYRLNMGGHIHMNNNDIDNVNQLHFNANVRFYDDSNDQYLIYKWGDTGAGGIKFIDGDNNLQGYVYGHNENFGLISADGSWAVQATNAKTLLNHRLDTPIIYDSDNTAYFMDLSTNNDSLVARGTVHIGPEGNLGLGDLSHPKIAYPGEAAQWGATGTSTGQIIIDLPGTLANYDMTYLEIDVFEYDSKGGAKIIIGSHNWNSGGDSGTSNLMWYNTDVRIVGRFDHEIYLGWRNNGSVNKRVIVLGTHTSSWSYGTVHVAKVSGGTYYTNSIDWTGDWNVTQNTSSSAYTKSPTTNWNDSDSRNMRVYRSAQANRVYADADMRAPIYYDNNDTALYLNPNSLSNIYQLTAAHIIQSNNSVRGPIFYDTNNTAYYADPASTSQFSIHKVLGTTSSTSPTTGALIVSGGIGTNERITAANIIQSNQDVRGPVFYDSNNTTYYFDGSNSTTSIEVNGTIRVEQGSHSHGNLELQYDHGATGSFTDTTNSSQMCMWVSEPGISYSSGGIGINIDESGPYYGRRINGGYGSWLQFRKDNGDATFKVTQGNNGSSGTHLSNLTIAAGGVITARTDSRAPAFYDSADTGYYGDFASTSVLNSATMAGSLLMTAEGATNIKTRFIMGKASGSTNSGQLYLNYGQSSSVNIGTGATADLNVTGNAYISLSTRSPIFYDLNNTAYYGDFASTSVMNQTRHNGIQAGYVSGLTGGIGQVGIYSTSGPYISFHHNQTTRTGYLQNFSSKFYFGETPYTETTGSFRAPLFYDVNNTAYYTDPAGNTLLNQLSVVSAATSSTLTRIYCSHDSYVRYQTPANFGISIAPHVPYNVSKSVLQSKIIRIAAANFGNLITKRTLHTATNKFIVVEEMTLFFDTPSSGGANPVLAAGPGSLAGHLSCSVFTEWSGGNHRDGALNIKAGEINRPFGTTTYKKFLKAAFRDTLATDADTQRQAIPGNITSWTTKVQVGINSPLASAGSGSWYAYVQVKFREFDPQTELRNLTPDVTL